MRYQNPWTCSNPHRCAPPHVRSVKLLGSWDNFSKPYLMERDRRTGAGQWRGCHTFTDIVCDGQSQSPSSRSGGLKMGATYWYYVRLPILHLSLDPRLTKGSICWTMM